MTNSICPECGYSPEDSYLCKMAGFEKALAMADAIAFRRSEGIWLMSEDNAGPTGTVYLMTEEQRMKAPARLVSLTRVEAE